LDDCIGYRWLARHYGVSPVQPFRVDSAIGKSRTTVREHGFVHETYKPGFRPRDSMAGHLAFALKQEGVHLEFLARLFDVLPASELEAWIASEPTGQYARRAGFFYEYLKPGRRLGLPDTASGNYVPALDEQRFLTATRSTNDSRWRVRDNLPGTPAYCPMVLRTAAVEEAERYDCAAHLRDLEVEFGADVLHRSAVWLTIKESRASFAIEHEEQHVDRVRRFAAVLESRCGRGDDPLSIETLTELQSEILGSRSTRYGIRRSAIFVGEVDRYTEVVHYIAPHWDDAPGLLAGLGAFAARTAGRPSLLRAGVMSFGFVYIHPMADGNGRISRFLINDVLRRDEAIPDPFILPISATINASVVDRRGYDQVLESFSRPLMRKYAQDWRFGELKTGEDGIRYDIEFDSYADALHAWRYPDLTTHVEYLAAVVRATIEQEMRKEAGHIRSLRLARKGIKEVLEGPDIDIDRIVRSIRDNGGKVSNKLKKEFPVLLDEVVAGALVEAVEAAFR
jgi:hypothetical protein